MTSSRFGETESKKAREILSYENPEIVDRFASEHGVSRAEAEAAFIGFKQFIGLCGATPGERKTVSEAVDNFWHVFLLFSKQYREFCESFLGGFLDHEPKADPESPKYYFQTRAHVQALYGELDERVWPSEPAAGARCISGGYCVPKPER